MGHFTEIFHGFTSALCNVNKIAKTISFARPWTSAGKKGEVKRVWFTLSIGGPESDHDEALIQLWTYI